MFSSDVFVPELVSLNIQPYDKVYAYSSTGKLKWNIGFEYGPQVYTVKNVDDFIVELFQIETRFAVDGSAIARWSNGNWFRWFIDPFSKELWTRNEETYKKELSLLPQEISHEKCLALKTKWKKLLDLPEIRIEKDLDFVCRYGFLK